jgi:hypothetical protein
VMLTSRSASENSSSRYCDAIARMTFRADGVMFPGKTMIPRWMCFSSRIVSNLASRSDGRVQHKSEAHILSHSLHTNTLLVREEDKDLVCWVINRVCKEVQLAATARDPLVYNHWLMKISLLHCATAVRILFPKLVQICIDFVVGNLESL